MKTLPPKIYSVSQLAAMDYGWSRVATWSAYAKRFVKENEGSDLLARISVSPNHHIVMTEKIAELIVKTYCKKDVDNQTKYLHR